MYTLDGSVVNILFTLQRINISRYIKTRYFMYIHVILHSIISQMVLIDGNDIVQWHHAGKISCFALLQCGCILLNELHLLIRTSWRDCEGGSNIVLVQQNSTSRTALPESPFLPCTSWLAFLMILLSFAFRLLPQQTTTCRMTLVTTIS